MGRCMNDTEAPLLHQIPGEDAPGLIIFSVCN